MNKFILFILLITLTSHSYTAPAFSSDDDAIVDHQEDAAATRAIEEAGKAVVARVNGTEITMESLVGAMNRVASRFVAPNQELTPDITEKVKNDALDLLIFEELVIQEAARLGIKPSSEMVDKAIEEMKKLTGSADEFQQFLSNIGLSEKEYIEQVKRRQQYELLIEKELIEKAQIDEKELLERYEKDKDGYVTQEIILIDEVFLAIRDDEKDVAEKAEKIHKQIVDQLGKDIWGLVLDGTFVVREIEISKKRTPEVHAAALKLEVGDLSEVVRDKDGFHIFLVKKKELEQQQTFEQARPYLEQRLTAAARENRKKEWENELRKKAIIEILLKEAEEKLRTQN